MAWITEDRVQESSTTNGSGNLTLSGALTGFRTFAAVAANNDTFWYTIQEVDASYNPTGNYEEGLGTFVSATPAIARTSVLKSSNSNNAVNFTGGNTKLISIGLLSGRVCQLDDELCMRLPAITVSPNPSVAPSGFLKVFAQKLANKTTPRYISPSGIDQTFQDKMSENGWSAYFPNGGSTAGLNLGVAWTATGTISHPTPSSTSPAIFNQQKRTRFANVVTTTNQVLGIHTVTAQKRYWRGNAAGLGGFNFHCRFAIGLWPAATVRLFVGLSDQNTAPVTSDTLAGNCCGLWHDTTDAASVLSFVTRNGTTATKAAITLGSNLAAGQAYDFWMYAEPNGSYVGYRLVDLSSGNVLVETTTTTTIPTSTAFMGQTIAMSNGTANTTVTTTALDLSGHCCQSDN